jgi:hypothetical protein
VLAPHFIDHSSRLRKPRTVRAATRQRIFRKSRARYTGVVRVFATVLCVLLLMSYVVLTSSLTGLSYAVAKAGADREALQEETMRLDDRIAAMRSDDRLSQLAARLGMHEPQRLAVVRLAPTPVARVHSRYPMLSSLAGLFMPAPNRKAEAR